MLQTTVPTLTSNRSIIVAIMVVKIFFTGLTVNLVVIIAIIMILVLTYIIVITAGIVTLVIIVLMVLVVILVARREILVRVVPHLNPFMLRGDTGRLFKCAWLNGSLK